MHRQFQECIEECLACMTLCNHCFDACLKEEDVKMVAECIRLTRECVDICSFAAKAMASGSPFASQIRQLCATICEAVPLNVRNMPTTMNIVKNVQNRAENVRMPAEKWLANSVHQKTTTFTAGGRFLMNKFYSAQSKSSINERLWYSFVKNKMNILGD